MRPTDFYALPTQRSEPWLGAYDSLVLLFDDVSLEHELDREAARAAGATAIAFDQKLFDPGDGERSISYEAVTFEGRPFAILVRSGRGGEDERSRYVTDLETYEAARRYVEAWRPQDARLSGDVVSPDEDLGILGGTYGHVVMQGDGPTRLVDVDHLDDSGRVLFDDRAFSAAFDRIVRPAFPVGGQEFRDGIRGERMSGLAVKALLEAVPEGVRATDDFDAIPAVEGFSPILGWSPVLVASDDATYALGLPAWSGGYFAWCVDIRLEKVGPPELYDELARAASPSP